jgi:hypothetical protein
MVHEQNGRANLINIGLYTCILAAERHDEIEVIVNGFLPHQELTPG